jgi:hypothetical protein
MCLACSLRLLPLWALLLTGLLSFWAGLYVLAIRLAGVAPAQLGLSRVSPVLTVCLEVLCTGEAAGVSVCCARCARAARLCRVLRLLHAELCRRVCMPRAASDVVRSLRRVCRNAGSGCRSDRAAPGSAPAGPWVHTSTRPRCTHSQTRMLLQHRTCHSTLCRTLNNCACLPMSLLFAVCRGGSVCTPPAAGIWRHQQQQQVWRQARQQRQQQQRQGCGIGRCQWWRPQLGC